MRSGSVSVLLVRPLVAAIGGSREALKTFFAATDLTPELVADADARMSPAQFCVAWAQATQLAADRALPLRVADATPAGAFGVVEYVCRAAPTLGEALRQWVRYLNLLDDAVEVGLVEDEEGHACVRVLAESEAPAPASHELCFALLARQARGLCVAPVPALAVEFTHRAPGDLASWRRSFGAPVRFGAESTQLVFAAEALATPLRTSDPNLLEVLRRHADELQKRDRDAPPLTAQLKRILRAALRDGDADLEPCARRLGLTGRSLQRRLKDEGTSFNLVRESVRRELATRYLDDDLSIAEISFLLGFSEPSAFFRAFKRWTGLTPVESRARSRAALA
jgi:AraC-like DNA-binding protein